MRKPLLIIGLLAGIVYACNQQHNNMNSLLSTGKLSAQVFSIDITKDTTLHTKNGALIRIPHGALASSSNTVQLEVKEAYSIQDIIKAGLTTMSNGQPLSSGGMIYINAVGENTVKITQKITIATPTPFLDSNMQLYKGEVKSDSTINWVDPKPLPENPQLNALDKGKILFQDNCASCHALGRNLTGPDLAHVIKRYAPFYGEGSGLSHPYDYIRNPAKAMIHSGYHWCLHKKLGAAVMSSFNNLTDTEVHNLYAYIENESERRNLPIPDVKLLECYQKCKQYQEIVSKWSEIKSQLEKDSSYLLQDLRFAPVNPTPDTSSPVFQPPPPTFEEIETVSPAQNKSLFYQFTIESFGWYNIDILLKPETGAVPSELMVRMQGQYKERFSIYLIIPSIKLLAPGGPLKDQKDVYGFYQTNGAILLPQQAKAFILAMGEYEDKIIFAKREFITQKKQSFDLELTTITKEAFQQQIGSLQIGNDINIKAADTKNATELRKAIKELKNAEQLKPKDCDCDCFFSEAAPQVSNIDWGAKESIPNTKP